MRLPGLWRRRRQGSCKLVGRPDAGGITGAAAGTRAERMKRRYQNTPRDRPCGAVLVAPRTARAAVLPRAWGLGWGVP